MAGDRAAAPLTPAIPGVSRAPLEPADAESGDPAIVDRRPAAWRRLLRKRLSMASLALILLLAMAALLAPWLAPHDPLLIDYDRIDGYPDLAHRYLFGNDSTGRDVFARILYGLRVSLTVAVVVETIN